jgi:hypothetical protein
MDQKLISLMSEKGFDWCPPSFTCGQINITIFLMSNEELGWKVHHHGRDGTKTSEPTFRSPVAAATYAKVVYRDELGAEPTVSDALLEALTRR